MKKALIIGAGPAGLTAAWELLTKTDIIPVLVEADSQVGGISKTVNHNGNKIDIGGHRFFSKSEEVINWWLNFLPLDPDETSKKIRIGYRNSNQEFVPGSPGPVDKEKVMLVRPRKSRIYYHKKLFDYPLRLNASTLSKLGMVKTIRSAFSFILSRIFPHKPEKSLEQFFINRFGKELYLTFFKEYTEKVWGVPCNQIPASWGHQRVKNLDIWKLIRHSVKSSLKKDKSLDQRNTSTSLIEQFLYPRSGPGQMWETVADEILRLGGEIHLNTSVVKLHGDNIRRIVSADTQNQNTGELQNISADYFFSTMPVKELFLQMKSLPIPAHVREVAEALQYRDFLIVGLLADELLLKEKDGTEITDNWIYIQDNNLKAGRMQLFHNWSPAMIAVTGTKWIGVEYFCDENDQFWKLEEDEIIKIAIREMQSIGILSPGAVRDSVVVKVKKAYPSYHGVYEKFPVVQDFLDTIPNLFPVGRNGMHRYNNSDHSMLTAIAAVNSIISGSADKSAIWQINTEEEYLEEEKER